jgi:hypothetical protein
VYTYIYLTAKPQKTGEKSMKDIILYVVIILMGIMGGGASIYILVSLPAMLIWKIYRKIRYGYSMFD